jgi:hypothetical protein
VGALVAWGLLLSFGSSAWTFLTLPYFAYNCRTSGALDGTTVHDWLLAVLCHLLLCRSMVDVFVLQILAFFYSHFPSNDLWRHSRQT